MPYRTLKLSFLLLLSGCDMLDKLGKEDGGGGNGGGDESVVDSGWWDSGWWDSGWWDSGGGGGGGGGGACEELIDMSCACPGVTEEACDVVRETYSEVSDEICQQYIDMWTGCP